MQLKMYNMKFNDSFWTDTNVKPKHKSQNTLFCVVAVNSIYWPTKAFRNIANKYCGNHSSGVLDKSSQN